MMINTYKNVDKRKAAIIALVLTCVLALAGVLAKYVLTKNAVGDFSVNILSPPVEITYYANGGSFDVSGSVTENTVTYIDGSEYIGEYIEPYRGGYGLLGWYTDESCSDGKELDMENATGKINAYAKWEKAYPVLRSFAFDADDDFHNSAYNTKITTAEIVDSAEIPASPAAGPWDISAKSNGSVKAWLTLTTADDASTADVDETAYHLTIAGNGFGKIFANANSNYLFDGFSSLKTIDGLSLIETGGLKDSGGNYIVNPTTQMHRMFGECNALTSVDLSNWSVNATNVGNMFHNCRALISVGDISDWTVTGNAGYMFSGCVELTSVDLSDWNANLKNPSYMFNNCKKLTSVGDLSGWAVNGSVAHMFRNCSSLTTLNLSNWTADDITSTTYMFEGCTALTSVGDISGWTVSNSASYMFSGCSKLTSLDLTGWTANITDASYMFANCKLLTKVGDIKGWTINGYTTYMFQNCAVLASLDVTDWTVTTKNANNMFYGCKALTTINGISGWTIDGTAKNMFQNCNALKAVDLTNLTAKLTNANSMFYNCKALTSVGDISDWNINGSAGYMFYECNSLTSLDLSDWTTSLKGVNYMFYNCKMLEDIGDISDWNIDGSANLMFYNCLGLEILDLSNWIANLTNTNSMFLNCTNLKAIYAGDGFDVTNATDSAQMFQNCTSLVGGAGTAYDSNNIDKAYAHVDGGTANPGYFTDKNNITVRYNANGGIFDGDASITTNDVGYNQEGSIIRGTMKEPTKVGYTFEGWYNDADCTDGNELNLDNLTEFANVYAKWNLVPGLYETGTNKLIYSWEELKSQNLVTLSEDGTSITDCDTTLAGDLILSDDITTIGNEAFRYCTGLTSVNIPYSVTSIEYNSFYNCSRLEKITVDTNNTNFCSVDDVLYSKNMSKLLQYPAGKSGTSFTIPDSVVSLDHGAFYYCTELENIDLPDNLKTMGYYAFQGCSSLTEVVIPNTVTSISSNAFRECSNLSSITIPNSVTSISDQAFYGCSSLTSVDLSGVTSIGQWAFASCTNLATVTLSDSITSIGYCAFYSSNNISAAYYNGTPTQWNNITVGEYNTSLTNALIFLYDDLTSQYGLFSSETGEIIHSWDYLVATGLIAVSDDGVITTCSSSLEGVLVISDTVTSIGDYAFWGCSGLTNVIIPDVVISIGVAAFQQCSGLIEITIPESVTSIGERAFMQCGGLIEITIPNSVTIMGESVFSTCSNLTNVVIKGSISIIPETAFYDCIKLTTIVIPSSVTSIERSAFAWCSSLTTVYYPGSSSQWTSIAIENENDYNGYIVNATKVYNYVIPATADVSSFSVFGAEEVVSEVIESTEEIVSPENNVADESNSETTNSNATTEGDVTENNSSEQENTSVETPDNSEESTIPEITPEGRTGRTKPVPDVEKDNGNIEETPDASESKEENSSSESVDKSSAATGSSEKEEAEQTSSGSEETINPDSSSQQNEEQTATSEPTTSPENTIQFEELDVPEVAA